MRDYSSIARKRLWRIQELEEQIANLDLELQKERRQREWLEALTSKLADKIPDKKDSPNDNP